MDNKYKYLLMSIILIGLVIIVGTYAWLSYRSNDTAMVLTIGDINNVEVTLSPYQIKANILPQVTYVSDNYTNVNAVNNSTSLRKIKLFYKINNIDNELISNNFKYTIEKSTNGTTYTEYKTGNFNNTSNNSELTILEENIPGNNTTYKYKVYLWLDGTNSGQSNIQGKSFNGELRATIAENQYQVTFDPNGGVLYDNLMYGLENKEETTTTGMKYSVLNGVVTVTALKDDGYGFTTGRVDLEAGKTYRFSVESDATWGESSGSDTVQTFFMLDGQYNTYIHMNTSSLNSNGYYEFTPTVSGTYWLRLDVNQNGKTHTFSNISVVEKNTEPKIVTVGDTYGDLPVPTRDGYTFLGWNGKNLLNYNELSLAATNVNITVNNLGDISDSTPTSDSRAWGFTNSNWKTNMSSGLYTVSLLFSSQCTETINDNFVMYKVDGTKIYENGLIAGKSFVFTNITIETNDIIGFFVKAYDGIYRIQLEEGDTATEWEPYYITSDTTVVQDKNHTLTAIWEKN